ncbi:MAG: 3-hydroxyacyl-ACP dehydratase FabZ [Bdellovibrionales bacterium]
MIPQIAHRYPLLLVDRVLESRTGEYVKATKNVSFNEKVFLGHFPNHPIYPAIYIIEGLCQCAQVMLGAEKAVTAKLESFKFTRPVYPGDQITYEVELESMMGAFQIAKAVASVNGKAVSKGTIVGCKLSE